MDPMSCAAGVSSSFFKHSNSISSHTQCDLMLRNQIDVAEWTVGIYDKTKPIKYTYISSIILLLLLLLLSKSKAQVLLYWFSFDESMVCVSFASAIATTINHVFIGINFTFDFDERFNWRIRIWFLGRFWIMNANRTYFVYNELFVILYLAS